MYQHTPLYEDIPVYDRVTWYILGGILACTLVVGLVLLPFDLIGAYIMFGLTAFDALLFWTILPKRFQIFEDRFRIQLGGPFSVTMFFSTVTKIEKADIESAWVFWGMRFVTSTKYVIEVGRRNGLSVVFSPSKGEDFLEELIRAKDNYKEPDFSVFIDK